MSGWNLSGPALYFILSCIPLVFEEQAAKLGSLLTKLFTRKQDYFCKQWKSPVVEYLFTREENKMRLFGEKIMSKGLHSDGDATVMLWSTLVWGKKKLYTEAPESKRVTVAHSGCY